MQGGTEAARFAVQVHTLSAPAQQPAFHKHAVTGSTSSAPTWTRKVRVKRPGAAAPAAGAESTAKAEAAAAERTAKAEAAAAERTAKEEEPQPEVCPHGSGTKQSHTNEEDETREGIACGASHGPGTNTVVTRTPRPSSIAGAHLHSPSRCRALDA